jgi:hypothetical protein
MTWEHAGAVWELRVGELRVFYAVHEEQVRLASSLEFWALTEERRRQKTITPDELARRLDQLP